MFSINFVFEELRFYVLIFLYEKWLFKIDIFCLVIVYIVLLWDLLEVDVDDFLVYVEEILNLFDQIRLYVIWNISGKYYVVYN